MNSYDQECSKVELDLESSPPVNVSMEKGEFVTYRPLSSLDSGGPLEFIINGIPDTYLDLGRSKLYLKVKIIQADGTVLDETDHVAPVNLLLHSLFSQVDVKLKDTIVSSSLSTYAYKAYLETLLAYGSDSKRTHKIMEGYYEDGHKGMDKSKGGATPVNSGYDARAALVAESKSFELMGRVHSDIFHQDRLLLPGVDVSLKLIRSSPIFHLMHHASGYRVVIEEACFIVRKVKVNPTIALQHAQVLQSGQFLKYPMRRGVVTTAVIGQGVTSFYKDNLISGQLPRRVVLGLVTNKAFNGDPTRNPYNFTPMGLNYLTLSNGSQTFPTQPLTPDFAGGVYLQAYEALYSGLGYTNEDRSFGITPQAFAEGFTLYAFDLTADMCEGAHLDPIRYGDLKVEAHFSAGLAEPANLVIYAEYDNCLKIDASRNVITDYSQG
jgi:hypothetical protein